MKRFEANFWLCFLLILALFGSEIKAQSIDISRFYYRDYLDFGQNKGAFNGENSNFFGLNSGLNGTNSNANSNLGVNSNANSNSNTNYNANSNINFGVNSSANLNTNANSNGVTLTGKDGKALKVPNVPDFSPSSNYGSLTSVGRGFVVTANHVSSPESQSDLRKWGLTTYAIAGASSTPNISDPYGRDEKFVRFDKYVVEGQVDMLDIANTTHTSDSSSTAQETQNLANLKAELDKFKDKDGSVYLYQAGSGIIKLRGTSEYQGQMNALQSGETKGGGFGTLDYGAIQYADLVKCENCNIGDSRGIVFNYTPNADFNNRITSGDSGSGIYAYDSTNAKWVLLGVVSESYEHLGLNDAKISFVSSKDLQDYQSKFEQKIDLNGKKWTLQKPVGANLELNNNSTSQILQDNKDLIFSGGGNVEVSANINRNISGYAGGFVFTANSSASNPTTYKFTNSTATTHIFKGSGLDIGENVEVEWHLRNESGDSLHKIGLGTLIVKTAYTPDTNKGENLGYLKVGQGKVIFDTATKAYEGVYITSGRGELELKAGKAEAIGAVKNATNSNSVNFVANSTF